MTKSYDLQIKCIPKYIEIPYNDAREIKPLITLTAYSNASTEASTFTAQMATIQN
jgi:hypothetical protein